MKYQRKQKITLVSVLMLLSQQAHGFYPQYYRYPHRRRPVAARHYRRRHEGHMPHAARAIYDDQRAIKRSPHGKETIRDFKDRIELYIPCRHRNCHLYKVQLKDHRAGSGTKKIVVTGQQRNQYREYYEQLGIRHGMEQQVPFYENEWLVPSDVDAEEITRATMQGGFLKIIFPRHRTLGEKISLDDNYEAKNDKVRNPPQAHRSAMIGGPHGQHRDLDAERGPETKQDKASSKTPMPMKTPPGSWKPSPKVLEEEQRWTYPADPGIEVEDVDDCCVDEPKYGISGKSPSIGYWSREKFVYY